MSAAVPRFERALRSLLALQRGQAISAPWLMSTFRISRSQAKRDLYELERLLVVSRDRGRMTLSAS